MSNIHAFTSITANYLPKARVMAGSLKKCNQDISIHLLISDHIPDGFNLQHEPFDSCIHINDLDIPGGDSWIFKHSLVELCTAVKPFAFVEIFRRYHAEQVFYFDPDITVLSSIQPLLSKLRDASVLITPHQSLPNTTRETIWDNEICSSLQHGIYNLGFLAVKSSNQGMAFLEWWQSCLYEFCYDDVPNGLFTDQRWIDLAVVFFEEIAIVREPQYNVATWNLTKRTVLGNLQTGLYIDDKPLCFFHFSDIDSGHHDFMLEKFIGASVGLKELQRWYLDACKKSGQEKFKQSPWYFACYDNGEIISLHERQLYRSRPDLQQQFPLPFHTRNKEESYYDWYQANVPENARENNTPSAYKRMLKEKYLENHHLSLALQEAQQLAWERLPQIEKLDAALKHAQAVVLEKDQELARLTRGLSILRSAYKVYSGMEKTLLRMQKAVSFRPMQRPKKTNKR